MERKALFDVAEKRNDERTEEKIINSLIHSATSSDGWDCMHQDPYISVWFKDFVGTTVLYKDSVSEISEDRVCCMKGEILLKANPKDLKDLVVNIQKRLKWDALYSQGSVFQEISPKKSILHLIGLETESVDRLVDFSILQYVPTITEAQHHSGIRCIVSEFSTQAVPKKQEFVRGQVFPPSGVVIFQEKEKTRLIYLVRQLGSEGLGASMESQWEVFAKSLFELQKAAELLNEKSYTLL